MSGNKNWSTFVYEKSTKEKRRFPSIGQHLSTKHLQNKPDNVLSFMGGNKNWPALKIYDRETDSILSIMNGNQENAQHLSTKTFTKGKNGQHFVLQHRKLYKRRTDSILSFSIAENRQHLALPFVPILTATLRSF